MKPDWNSILHADPTGWLLEGTNPSVRYFTLKEILDEPDTSGLVAEARNAIMTTGVIPEILAKQNDDGSWADPRRFYTEKYKGTVWQLMILSELGADGKDPRIQRACEFIFNNSQEITSGGFSCYRSEKSGGGLPSYVIPCLTGNMVWSLIRLGYLDDGRVSRGLDWINTVQRFDDGEGPGPKGQPYDRFEACWGKHPCHLGAVKVLKALAEIPEEKRSALTRQTLVKGVEYFLAHHIYKRSHDYTAVSKPGWLKLGFPLMYQSDILEILLILAKLNCRDSRMQDAIDILISKQDDQGRWKMKNSYNGKVQVNIEKKGKPSKWLTLNALRVLKFYSLGNAK